METFWFIIMILALTWYTVVTAYVAIKGTKDVKHIMAGETDVSSARDQDC